MISYTGKYTNALVYSDVLEDSAATQIVAMINHCAFANQVCIMPDVHAGKGCVIGFTMPLTDRVVPSTLGVDLACGVFALNLGKKKVIRLNSVDNKSFKALDEHVRKYVPIGHNRQVKTLKKEWLKQIYKLVVADRVSLRLRSFEDFEAALDEIVIRTGQDVNTVWTSIGTLGGGNHYIELDVDLEDNVWLNLHSGSRNFGLKLAGHHQKLALEASGKQGGLEYLEGEQAQQYIKDCEVALAYSLLNKAAMAAIIMNFFDMTWSDVDEVVISTHNFIDPEDNILRKGAVAAREGQQVIVPFSMLDGCVVGIGKGNKDYNYSSPHGAGRTMSRKEAKAKLSLDAAKKKMHEAGIWTTCLTDGTLDETSLAYKDPEDIKKYLIETVDVTNVLKPVWNFKAAD